MKKIRSKQEFDKRVSYQVNRGTSMILIKGSQEVNKLPQIKKNKRRTKTNMSSQILAVQKWTKQRLQSFLFKKEIKIKKLFLFDQELKKKRFFQQVGQQIYDIAINHPKLQFYFGLKNKTLYSISFGRYLNMIFRMDTFFEVFQLKRIHSTIQISHQFYSIIKGLIFNKLFINQQFNVRQMVLGGIRMERNRGVFVNMKQAENLNIYSDIKRLFKFKELGLDNFLEAVTDFVLNYKYVKKINETKQKPFYLWQFIKLKKFFLKNVGNEIHLTYTYNKLLENLNFIKLKFMGRPSLKSQVLQKYKSIQEFTQEILKITKVRSKSSRIMQILINYLFQDQQYIFGRQQVLICTGLIDDRNMADKIYLQLLNLVKLLNFKQKFTNHLLQKLRSLRQLHRVIQNSQDDKFAKIKIVIQQSINTYKKNMNIYSDICPAQELAATFIGFQPYTKQQLKVIHQNVKSMSVMTNFRQHLGKALVQNQIGCKQSKYLMKQMKFVQNVIYE